MAYYSENQVGQIVGNLATTYPRFAQQIPLPHHSWEGRLSKALRLSSQPGTGKNTVLIIGGVHGAEWGSCEIALNLATMLLQAHTAGAGLVFGGKHFTPGQIQTLWAKCDLLIFPLVNPDGRNFSRLRASPADADWRKNRRPIFKDGAFQGFGVDINRNFDFVFDLKNFVPGSGPVASTSPGNPYYQGELPNSEAETQNVVWLLDTNPEVGWMVDLHSAGLSICYPWNHDEQQNLVPQMNFRVSRGRGEMGLPGQNYSEFMASPDANTMLMLAQRFAADASAVRQMPFDARPAFWNSAYPGTSHDYAYSRHLSDSSKSKVLSFVCEWGDLNPQPPWHEMQQVIAEVSAGLIGLCLAA